MEVITESSTSAAKSRFSITVFKEATEENEAVVEQQVLSIFSDTLTANYRPHFEQAVRPKSPVLLNNPECEINKFLTSKSTASSSKPPKNFRKKQNNKIKPYESEKDLRKRQTEDTTPKSQLKPSVKCCKLL